jgi:hypothetical protein
MPIILYNTFISRLIIEIEKTLERLTNIEIKARPFIKGIKPMSSVLNFLISNNN